MSVNEMCSPQPPQLKPEASLRPNTVPKPISTVAKEPRSDLTDGHWW